MKFIIFVQTIIARSLSPAGMDTPFDPSTITTKMPNKCTEIIAFAPYHSKANGDKGDPIF